MIERESRLGAPSIADGVRRTVLSNGLTLLTKESHAHPLVSSVMWYRVGARNESLGLTGTSHFLEHMLFKGTERHPKGSIDLLTLRNGGSNNALTWLDYTAYYFSFASDRWEVALELEADRMRGTLFEPDEFAAEKQVVIEELQIGLDGPWDELESELWAAAYRQHPYHNPTVGWIDDIKRATVDDMRAYYDAWYHPRNATLALVGDFDTDRVVARVEELFGGIPPGPEPPPMCIVEPPQRGEKRVVVRKPTPVERLAIAYHAPAVGHPDSYAVQVLEAALSLGKTARLYRRLVETDRSVSLVGAGYNDHIDSSLFVVRAEVKPGFALGDVERAIDDEIAKVVEQGLRPGELARIVRRIRADLILSNEQVLNQAMLLGEYETIAVNEHLGEGDRGYAYLANYFDRVAAVTEDEVRAAAAAYLNPDNRTIGWLVSNGEVADEATAGDAPEHAAARSRAAYRRPPGLEDTAAAETVVASGAHGPRLDVERFTLPNGLTVLLAPNEGVPAFCMSAVVAAGARYEGDEVAGLASLVGAMLEEGTVRRSPDEIAEAIEDVGGHLSTFGGYSHSGVRVVGLAEDLDLCVDLAADCLRNPVFPEDRVRMFVDRRLALLKSRADQPRARAAELFDEIVCAGHPSHRPTHGYEASVAALTRDQLVAFHRAFYWPNDTVLALAGRFDPAVARAAVERYFGDWARADGHVLPQPPELRRQTEPVERFVHADKSQVNLYLGHLGVRRTDPDYYSLLVLDTILGSSPGFTSRIPRILRDEQGLAYSTFANVTGSAGLDPGRFVAYIGTSPANLDRAIEGLRAEIERIVREPVEADELETAKAYLTGSFVFKFQTNAQIAGYLVDAEIFGLGFNFLERYPRLVDAVTIEDVARAARAHIDPSAMTLVVVGPTGPK
jgi:zinc protease